MALMPDAERRAPNRITGAARRASAAAESVLARVRKPLDRRNARRERRAALRERHDARRDALHNATRACHALSHAVDAYAMVRSHALRTEFKRPPPRILRRGGDLTLSPRNSRAGRASICHWCAGRRAPMRSLARGCTSRAAR
jgi:hypothetical protein